MLALVGRLVLDLTTAGLPLMRSFGSVGSSAVVGQSFQFAASGSGKMCVTPWSGTTVLVPDTGNGRLVEVDIVSGLLVKVWITGIDQPVAAAASLSVIAVANRGSTAKVAMYDVSTGSLLRSFGSTSLGDGDTSNIGVYLGFPWGLQFSQDATTMSVTEIHAQRVTRWTVSTAAYVSGTCARVMAGKPVCCL
jgi:hypothetical protein